MNKKIVTIIEIVAIIIVLILALCFKFYPEYQKTKGSSDYFINTKNYEDLVEIKINNSTNFILMISSNNRVNHIIFLDETSLCLYNKSIENLDLAPAIKKIVELLIENNQLKQNDTITLTNYKNKYYQKTKKELLINLEKYQIITNLVEKNTTVSKRAKELDLVTEETEEKQFLSILDLYSKEIIRRNNNDVSRGNTPNIESKALTETDAKVYANNVYMKIERHASENKIITQDKNSTILPITLIPADQNGKYYPTSNSWYYINDGKVYAYIEFDSTYSFCYQGTIDDYKKGKC